MAGAGCESTRETIEFSKKAEELGADLVSLVSPSYFKKSLTDDALIGYYTDVAEAISIPVFAYNAPGFTGLTLTPKVVATISKHPNVGGMKDTSPDGIARYLEVCGMILMCFREPLAPFSLDWHWEPPVVLSPSQTPFPERVVNYTRNGRAAI